MESQRTRAVTCEGRDRILAAALEEFSTHGVDGTTLRQIAERAGTQHQLIVYHFKSKDTLWKAVVADICAETHDWMKALEAEQKALGPANALKMMVSRFVAFTARRPELHRMLTFEGRSENARLSWWIEEHVKPFYRFSTGLIRDAQRAGSAREGHPGRLHYAMIGLVTTSFVFETEYRAMTKLNAFSEREIAEITQLAQAFLGLA